MNGPLTTSRSIDVRPAGRYPLCEGTGRRNVFAYGQEIGTYDCPGCDSPDCPARREPAAVVNVTERWCVHCGAHQLASVPVPMPHLADCPALTDVYEEGTWDEPPWAVPFDPETLTARPSATIDRRLRTSPHGDALDTTVRTPWPCFFSSQSPSPFSFPSPFSNVVAEADQRSARRLADWEESPLSFRNFFAGCNFVKLTWISPPWAYDAAIVENGMGC